MLKYTKRLIEGYVTVIVPELSVWLGTPVTTWEVTSTSTAKSTVVRVHPVPVTVAARGMYLFCGLESNRVLKRYVGKYPEFSSVL